MKILSTEDKVKILSTEDKMSLCRWHYRKKFLHSVLFPHFTPKQTNSAPHFTQKHTNSAPSMPLPPCSPRVPLSHHQVRIAGLSHAFYLAISRRLRNAHHRLLVIFSLCTTAYLKQSDSEKSLSGNTESSANRQEI
jgi:hypothetical protein